MTDQRRLHERHVIEVPVTVVVGATKVLGTTENISLGGMLVRTEAPLAFGAEVVLHVALPGSGEHEMPATVRWIQGESIGFQFGLLRAKATWALNQLFKTR